MRFVIPLLVATFVAGAPALAQDAATAPLKPKKARKICRDVEKPGSHLVASVCKTKAEWDGVPEVEGNVYIPGNRVATSRGN